MLSSLEHETLMEFGYASLGILTQVTVSSFLYGIFALLFAFSAHSVLKRQTKSRPTQVIFGLTIISFLLATVYWTAVVMNSCRLIRQRLMDHTEDLQLDRAARQRLQMQRNEFVNQIMYWTPQLLQILNDSIIVWRAWVLCQGQRWLTVLPILLLLSTFGTSFAFLITILSAEGYADYTHDGPSSTDGLLYASASLLFTNNVVSTSLIAYRLWLCRRTWTSGLRGRWSHAQKILLMVVESGALYAVLQLSVAFLFNQDHKPGTILFYVESIVWVGYIYLTAMYATLVSVLISQRRSLSDMECFSIHNSTEKPSLRTENSGEKA
ncbi:hypothetical protein H2248_003516 [Termitomyces sp. 'cryptogamus']|nr:hypothetical protein H2248_003516 [Termitomyces sp. 'cryptogamus']